MSGIIVEHFCGLSGNALWQDWLYQYDSTLYQGLIDHLRAGKGCAQNRAKMTEIMATISARPAGRETLMQFLETQFPAVLEHAATQTTRSDKPATPARSELPPAAVPFSSTNSTELPYRAIIDNWDPIALQGVVRQYTSQYPHCQYLILGQRAYIEYIPHGMAAQPIPAYKWLIPAFKRRRG